MLGLVWAQELVCSVLWAQESAGSLKYSAMRKQMRLAPG